MKRAFIALAVAISLGQLDLSAQHLGLDSALWQLDGTGYCVAEDTIADRILVGGEFERVLPRTPVPYGVEVSASSGFMTAGQPAANGAVRCVIPDGSGGWILGGDFTTMGGAPRQHLAHILSDGSLAAWSPAVVGKVYTLALQGDTLYLGGGFTSVNASARSHLAAVRLTTGSNVTWLSASADDTVRCMSINSGRLYIGGDFTLVNGITHARVASFTLSTHALTSWSPTFNNSVRSLVATASSIYVGGDFTLVNLFTGRNHAAALAPTTTTVQAWNPNANGKVRSLVMSGTDIFLGGDFTTMGGNTRSYIALVSSGGVLNTWSPGLDGAVHCMALMNNTVYAGGELTRANGLCRQRLVAFGVPGSGLSTITDWTAAADSTVMTIAAHGSQLYVGGHFVEGGGLSRQNMAALDLATGLPLPWAPQVNGRVRTVVRAGAGAVFVGGEFTQVGAMSRPYIGAIDPVTAQGLSWNALAAGGRVRKIRSRGDTLFVCGDFAFLGGQPRSHLALLSATTGNALPWNVPLASSDTPLDLLLSNDTLYVAGIISSVGGIARNAVAAIRISNAVVLPFTADNGIYATADHLCKIGNTLFCGDAGGTWGGLLDIARIRAMDATTGALFPWVSSFPAALATRGGRLYESDLYLRVKDLSTGLQVAGLDGWHDKWADVIITRNGDVIGVGSSTFGGWPQGIARAFATPNLTLRVMLDGPFSAGLMSDELRQQQLIPFTEPYTALGYVHAGGGGGEQAPPQLFTTTWNGADSTRFVDWVLIEYRDASDPSIVVASLSAMIQRDGYIRGTNSAHLTYLPGYAAGTNGSYYVAVRHRNHLGVMTAQPVNFANSPIIDFTRLSTPVFGSDARRTNSGVQTLWSGNVNFDDVLKYTGSDNDRDPILVRIGGSVPTNVATGYHSEDVNMDGKVKYTGANNDRDPILVNIGGSVPTNVRHEQVP